MLDFVLSQALEYLLGSLCCISLVESLMKVVPNISKNA